MKKLLSLLLAYAFLQAQTWAIGGGPNTGTSTVALSGTYSGVMYPTSQTNPSPTNANSATSIGLFSVGVPLSGVATGSAVVFVDGVAYIGDMTAVADPQESTLVGIVEGVSNYDIITLVPVVDANGNVTFDEVETQIFAQGNIECDIKQNGPALDATGIPNGSTRLEGTATLDLFATLNADGTPDIDNTVEFAVDGFKQSDTVTTITFTLGNDPTNDPTNPTP